MDTLSAIPAYGPGVFVAVIDGSKARTLRGFYSRITEVLHFPDYFGRNLDALLDCLCSLDNIDSQEVVLQIRHAEKFLSRENPAQKEAAFEVLRAAELPANRYDAMKFRVQMVY